jgi:hypothetical protein
MKTNLVVCAVLAMGAAETLLTACSGDDTVAALPDAAAPKDGGGSADGTAGPVDGGADVTPQEAAANDAPSDAASDGGDASDANNAPPPARLLLSYNGSSSSELVAFNVATKQVDGRLAYPGFIGTTATTDRNPYLLEQASDIVAKLDRAQPWIVRSSWSVKLADTPDGGPNYSDPDGIVVGAGTKAYVLRYTRNQIAIVDTSQTADAGAPTGSIDLTPLVQAADADGVVEMSAGVYVPSKQLVYVLLGNINRKNVAPDGFTQLCSNTKATVIAIDPATDKVVPLTGGNAKGAIELGGFGPEFGGGFAYDAANDRLIVVHTGCNLLVDGGAGPIAQREIEEVSLFTGATRKLLDANAMGFPGTFAYVDAHRAIVQYSAPDFSSTSTYVWDPTQPTLSGAIANAPDSWVFDGQDALLGLTTSFLADGGSRFDVVSVRIADGRLTTLGSNPFSLASGFISGVDLWPHP